MKKMTAIVVTLALAKAASAAVGLPYSIAFETNVPVGSTILSNANAGAWNGTDGALAIVTNLNYSSDRQSPVVEYPLSSESHSNVLKFSDGTISNMISAPGISQVWLDTMIQPVFSETVPTNAAITNSQMSVCFTTNGYMNVYHGVKPDIKWGDLPAYGQWTMVSNSFGAVQTGKWIRVTVAMKYLGGDIQQAFFQAKINGVTFSNELAYVDPEVDVDYSTNGSWFLCANYVGNELHQVALSGSGMLDDLVISTNAGSYGASLPSVYVTFTGNGSVTPSGTVTLPASPGSTNFNILASTYYQIASVYTGIVAGASNAIVTAQGAGNYDLVWSNITVDSTLFVNFEAQVATNNTPVYWMADKGLTTNGGYGTTWDAVALYDKDGDGMITWQEYVAGTHPDISNSVLKILSQTVSNGIPRLTWLSSTSAVAPYVVQLSTNLPNAIWSNVAANVSATDGGTNVLDLPTPAAVPAFYRVTITN